MGLPVHRLMRANDIATKKIRTTEFDFMKKKRKFKELWKPKRMKIKNED